VFKVVALGTGMFYAIKWHYDQDKNERRAMLRAGGKIGAVLVLSLVGVGLFTFVLCRVLGLDLGLS
jgi:hypothetical protein